MNLQTGSRPAGPFASRRRPISRRHFLHGSAVAMALPFLESMGAPFVRASAAAAPRRMFCICNNLGVLPRPFFPTDAGRDYTPSPYLKHLEEHRADFTVLSGVSHPFVDGGHPSDICFLTAAPHPASSSFRNSISLDQLVAERIGMLTRFPSLTLAVNGGRRLSWTRTGGAMPPEGRAGGGWWAAVLHPPGGAAPRVFPAALPPGDARRDRAADPRAGHGAEHPGRGIRAGQG